MKYKYLNWLLVFVMALGSLFLCVFRILGGNYERIATDLVILLVLFIPFVLNKFKIKLNDKEKFIFYLFIFVAEFLGCVVNLFDKIGWFDTFAHFFSGVFFFLVGIKLLKLIKKYDKKNIVFNLLFILGIVFMSAGLWEIFEYGMDSIIGTDLQHNKTTGVKDTMVDMIACFGGGVISAIVYFFNSRLKGDK